jgi:hypothetical protein
MSSASAVKLPFVLRAIKVAFRFCDQPVVVDLPKFTAADSNAFSRLSARKENIDGTSKSVLGGGMKIKAIGLTLALCFFAGAACFADDPQMGTWKLNEAKSKTAPDTEKLSTVVYEAVGDQVKCTIDGTDASGKPIHNEWTGKFDGKDYAVTGDPTSDMRSYKKISDVCLIATASWRSPRRRMARQPSPGALL